MIIEFRKISRILSAIILCLLVSFLPAKSQVDELDSLITILEDMPEDSARVDFLIGISKSLYYSDPTTALDYIQQAEIISNKIGYENGDIFKTKGNLRYNTGDYMDALEDYLISLKIFEKNNDTLNIANVYNNLGILYEDQGNYDEAKKYYFNALDIFRSLNDFHGQATVYLNLGWLHDNNGHLDSAIASYNRSISINNEIKDKNLDAILQGNLGIAYMHNGDYDSATYFFDKGLEKYEAVRDVEGVTEIQQNLGELNILQGNYNKGLEHLDEAIELATPHNFKEYLVESYRLKSEAYEELSQYEESLEYHQKYKELSDSIFTAERDQALYAYQISQQHKNEMAELNQQNQIQSERLKSARFKNFLLVSISIFSLLVMLILTYYFMHKHKTSMQLKYQNLEIVNQKKEIDGQKKILSRINKDLQAKNNTLNQLNKEKNYLLHIVAHDLKAPLNQMSGLSQVIKLESENLSENQLSCVEKIDTVSSRLSSMVDKILDIDAIEKKSNNLSLEEIDLREILDETVEDFEGVANEKKIKIHANLNGKTTPVKVDRQHVSQVFENLISNAIKFSPPNKEVFVNIKEDTNEIITEVKDQGPGLTDDDKQRVFKKFQKLSAQPTANEGSNGLGLSIVKKYVEAMNGKVWVESVFGRGASFKVAFKKI